jgi:hypothetical protein
MGENTYSQLRWPSMHLPFKRVYPLIACLAALAPPASAQLYKCVGPDGGITYSQTACPEPAASGGASADASRRDPVDQAAVRSMSRPVGRGSVCGRVSEYALEVAVAMRAGVGLQDAFTALGGKWRQRDSSYAGGSAGYRRSTDGNSGNLGDDAAQVVREVFAFSERGELSADLVVDFIDARCQRGELNLTRGTVAGADGIPLLSATGILLNPQGVVLTADAAVRDCSGLRLVGQEGWYAGMVLHRKPELNLALLVASGLRGRPAVFADRDLGEGEFAYLVRRPLRDVLTGDQTVEATEAPVAAPDGSPGSPSQASFLSLSLPESPAQTGAPLIGSGGLIAGMVVPTETEAGGGYALLRGSAIRALLDAEGIDYYRTAALGRLTEREIGRRAAGFMVHVECLP